MSVSTAQYPLLPERRFPISNVPDYYSGNAHWQPFVPKSPPNFFVAGSPSSSSSCSWDTAQSLPNWQPHTNEQSSFCPPSSEMLESNCALMPSPEYPQSSQRTILPPSPPSISGAITQPESFTRAPSQSTLGSLERNDGSWSDELHTSDDYEQLSSLPSVGTPSTPAVKIEPDDSEGGFIMELVTPDTTEYLQSLVPPTEVPLRATQASKEMRKMMGVFRLNPFAMHSGSGKGVSSSAWYGEDVGPLDEEPVLLEFQIELGEGHLPIVLKGEDELRSFSPDFEVDASRDGSRTEWTETDSESAFRTSPLDPWLFAPTPPSYLHTPDLIPDDVHTAQSAQLQYTAGSDRSKRLYPAQGRIYTPQRPPSSHCNPQSALHRTRISRPSSEPSSWPSPPNSRPVTGNPTFLPSGSDNYGASLPSIAATSRRWSLPTSNPNAPFLM